MRGLPSLRALDEEAAGGPRGRTQPWSEVWRGRGCWLTSSPASSRITCRFTASKISSRGRNSRFRAPRRRSGAGTWPTCFCTDGAVPIDNNISEREMKRVVLNRKNSLFVGNPRGGRTAAILASLTSTCRRHDLDPQLYPTQLLMNLPTWPQRELDAWLPDLWKLRYAARIASLNQQNSTIPDNLASLAPE